ncbi:MAG: penicillin-binding protein 2, partial [Candidatus Falkowbacteria bacterium]|nr:penicillin-binding protein 2 [Candidatus Falkowbacteria bacterium]
MRLVWLQIINGEHYYSLAQGNRIRLERVEPKRGIIYDKDHRPLVRNVANFLLYFTPSDFSKDKLTRLEILFKISQILENNPSMNSMESELKDIKRGSLKFYQPLFIADSIPYEKAMKLLLVSKNWPGVIITNKTRREYDLDSLSMSHLLGYTGKISQSELEKNNNSDYYPIDYVGKMGLENFWETELRGIKGQKQIEVDALGKEKRIIQEEAPIDGSHLVISIDSFLQQKIEQITLEHLKDFKVKRAVIIASNPANGEIMAMVNIPSFNNNAFARGIAQKEYDELIDNEDRPLLDRAIGGEYPSGSTIKLVMSAAALQDGIINEKTTFLSTGGLRIKDWFFPDWKAGGHGRTDVKKALADSVNTFYYYIGGGDGDFQGLGVNKIVYYATLFGLNAQTGIDLPGESSGFLPTKEWKLVTKGERWYIGDTYHLAIGQGDILVTPLQVAMFTSTVANGGKLYRPHLVKEIISPKNETVKTIDDTPVRENFISPQNIDIIKQGMRQSVTSGS